MPMKIKKSILTSIINRGVARSKKWGLTTARILKKPNVMRYGWDWSPLSIKSTGSSPN